MGTAIYVHIPFCVKKCGYCDFLSMNAGDEVVDAYFKALYRQIILEAENINDGVSSIYIGGGTPSFVNEKYIVGLLDAVYNNFKVFKDAEISIEANPFSSTTDKLKTYYNSGINRISFGLQSTNDRLLKILGRAHNYEDFLRSIDIALSAGFDNINADLIYSVAKQSLYGFKDRLMYDVKLKLTQISAYSLIIEPGTPFYERYHSDEENRAKGGFSGALCSEDTDIKMMWEAHNILDKYGYKKYEISNYAFNNYKCRHNLAYWKRYDYFGFGIGAASLFKGKRFSVIRDLEKYIYLLNKEDLDIKDIYENIEVLSKNDEISEALILGLRLADGIDITEINARYKIDILNLYRNEIDKNITSGLLEKANNRLFLTDNGVNLANLVMSDFIL